MNNKLFEYDVNEVIPNLWLGNYKAACDKKFLDTYKIKNVVTIMDNFNNNCKYKGIRYVSIPIKDKKVCNIDFNDIFDKVSKFIKLCLENNQPVLVHCKKGHHRSAALVVGFLIKYGKADFVKSVEYINKLRPYALRRDTCMSRNLFKYYLYINNKSCNFDCKPHGKVHYCSCA